MEQAVVLHHLDDGQQWVVFAALRARAALGNLSALLRVLAYVLAHCGMGLSAPLIAALTGVSDRAVRTTKALTAEQLLHSVRTPPRGKPKLGSEHAGAMAKFLFEHPKVQVKDIVAFARKELGVHLDRKTLRVYLTRHGLGCLRDGEVADTPFLSEPRASGARSS